MTLRAVVLLAAVGCSGPALGSGEEPRREGDPAPGHSRVRVGGLRCEHRTDPLGVDAPRPRLSWVLESSERGQRQTAYQVLAAKDARDLEADRGGLWDSGKVDSAQSALVPYGGRELASGERAWWKVRVWDKDGAPSPWSAPAFWEAGLRGPADWGARWIGLKPEAPGAARLVTGDLKWVWFPEGNPAASAPKGERYFRDTVDLPRDRALKRAEFYLTADNRFTLWVNGRRCGEGQSWNQFERVDVKEHVVPGTNTLAVRAANEDGPAGLIGQLVVEFESGEPLAASIDKSWRTSNQKENDWQNPGFNDKDWAAAVELAPLGQGPWGNQLSEKSVGGAPPDPCPLLRKTFTLARPAARARLYATALGVYELRLNGRRVGEDVFAPGWTDYAKRLQYQTYDVTSLLVEGENVLGAILGDGWFQGKIGWMRRAHGVYGPGPTRLLLRLDVEKADGGRLVVTSDESWKGAPGPILQSDFMDGETYDARLERPGWDRAGFDAGGWDAVDVIEDKAPRKLVAQPDAGVRVTEELLPVSVKEPKPGVFVFDLAQNMVGWVRLRVSGPAGTAVTLRFAEMLNPDGTVYVANLRKAKCTDRYVLRGEGEEVWEPRFTFHGFRYVEVTGYPGRPGPGAVTGRVAHSAMPVHGSFSCSSKMLNKLQQNIVWGQRGNFLSIPTDCPQRDERLGWMGDAQIFVRTACFNMDAAAFFTKWCRDVVDAQNPDGAFADVAPRLSGVLPPDASPAWGDAGVICPWVVYLCTGDRQILQEHYPAFVKWVEHVRRANPDLLWTKRVGNNYGDWVAVGSNTDKGVLATAYFAQTTRLVSRIAKVLGKEEDARKYEELFGRIRAAFNKAYVAPDGKIKSHTQTCYLLALRFDLLPEGLRPAAVRYLVEDIRAHGTHLTTGFLGVGHLLPALSEAGQWDVAYRLLLNETFPSWGYSIKHGATTIWERWDGWTAEKGFQDPGMNSFNHYSFGSVGEWMYAHIAGIDLDPENPGYKRVLVRPRPGGGLTFAKGELQTPYGRVATEWRIEAKQFRLKVVIPPNATAVVTLPYARNAREGGRALSGAVQEIGSGAYEFSADVE
jgi:alpha-L-rhamnosidase